MMPLCNPLDMLRQLELANAKGLCLLLHQSKPALRHRQYVLVMTNREVTDQVHLLATMRHQQLILSKMNENN